MIKSAIFSFFMLFPFIGIMAQNCEPDNTIPNDEFGVFPMPYDATENPNGGIRDSACLNGNYRFVFTANVGDSFPFGQNNLPLDSLRLGKTGAVSGLPKGISYACNPPSCSFASGTQGCVVLEGMVTDAAEVGDHELILNGTLYANGSPSGLSVNFPNPLIAPGKYTLNVKAGDDPSCEGLSTESLTNTQWSVYPNPSNGIIRIAMEGLQSEVATLSIVNSTGNVLHQAVVGDLSQYQWQLPAGVYVVMLQHNNLLETKRVVVQP